MKVLKREWTKEKGDGDIYTYKFGEDIIFHGIQGEIVRGI